MRIVSLLPSLTEICCALGLDTELVAVTHECDFPPRVRAKPKVTRSVLPPGLSHGEIDAAVRALVQAGQPLYALDLDLLWQLQPDLILTQALCPVCAVSYDDVLQIAKSLPGTPRVVSVEPTTLDDVLDSIRVVGEQTGRQVTAAAVIASLEHRILRARQRCGHQHTRPGAVCLDWLDPPMVAGHWVPQMVELAGGRDLLGHVARPSFAVTWDAVYEARPDVLVLMPCGYDLAGTSALAAAFSDQLGRREIPAIATGRVYAVDASSYFSRPGPRLVTGLELLAAALHSAGCSPSEWPAGIAPLSQILPEPVR